MLKSAAQLIEEGNKIAPPLSATQAKGILRQDGVLFVDLRDVRELWREGTIPGAIHAPRGMLEFWVDPDCKYYRKDFEGAQKIVLFCASAWRSALAAKALIEMGLPDVTHLEGGFSAWKAAKFEIKEVKNPYLGREVEPKRF